VVICLEQGANLHVAQLMPLPLTVSCFSKSRLVVPFWYRLTRVVPDKGPLNGFVCLFLFVKVTKTSRGLDYEIGGRLRHRVTPVRWEPTATKGNGTVVES